MPPKNAGKDKGGKSKDTKNNSKDGKNTNKNAKGGEKAGEASTGKVKGAQSINVRHILCEKHSKKEDALGKLREGVKFDEVAREFGEDKGRQGGSLGWKTKGSLLPEFEKAAFDLETSTTANPKWVEVKTSEGYHIIMVEGRK
ncbi:FKBP-like protein [Aulographum hederae CBS 113979]|uniref:Peptidyl-prolyl cis-trans isomerase n=1 Tax=Aulographum hederae CBS 113979 TaxID=1176131 RepID=A0A6G1GSH8_9PEZI|nr:FKBP-like protein [Aulographum hederae CBS 113979]